MPTLTITKTYADGLVLLEADLDHIKNDIETFLNFSAGGTGINDDNIQNQGITASSKIVASSVITSLLAGSAVTTPKIADLNVTTAKIADGAVTAIKIADGTIQPAKISHSVRFVPTADDVLATDEVLIVDTTASDILETLPTAIGNPFRVLFEKSSSDNNRVTFDTDLGQTIGGYAPNLILLECKGDWIELTSDNANWQITDRGFSVVRGKRTLTANQTINNNADTLVTLDTVDAVNMNSSLSRLDIKIAGRYDISAMVAYQLNNAGYRHIYIYLNGTRIWGQSTPGVVNGALGYLSATVDDVALAIGDYVEVFTYQNSGGALFLDASNTKTNFLSIVRRGPTNDI